MAGNFGWDFIYRDWGSDFAEISDWAAEMYSHCDRLFRLPFYEPMTSFSKAHSQDRVFNVGLTGGYPRHSAEEMRSLLGLQAEKFTVLLTFGGLSLNQIPYHNLALFPDWQFITFDASAPELPNLLKIGDKKWRPVDIMPICGRVVSKPGYGTFSEATKLGLPIVSITREEFAEAAFIVSGIVNYNHHQILTPSEFFQGTWDFLRQPTQAPKQSQPIARDGNETIAHAVIKYLQI